MSLEFQSKLLPEFKIFTTNCGIKYKNRDDLLLVKMPENTETAGVFTTSSTAAAPVLWCKRQIKSGKAKALVVNAGNANAFTGKQGEKAVLEICKSVANLIGCKNEEVFVSSTGVIGEPLKYELINKGLQQFAENFSHQGSAWIDAAKAIMTTDLKPKIAYKSCKIFGKKIDLVGFAKGSGMIAPNMATMLGYIFCNAKIDAKILQKLLGWASEESFNSITVDSDQSTNDTVLLFASGSAQNEIIDDFNSAELSEFKNALNQLCLELAKMIVIDGEGAKKLIEIEITGATNKKQAREVAFAVANSPLVKTAIAGADPNWGRIVMAVGKSCPKLNQNALKIWIGNQLVAENGMVVQSYSESIAHNYLKNSEVKILIDLALGNDFARVWTCDLNEEYIHINKDYRS